MIGGIDTGRAGCEERIAAEAGVPVATLRVEDPEHRPPARRAEPAPGDHHLRPLADDVPPEPDPRPTGELEAEAGRFAERLAEGRRELRRLQDDEHRAGPTGERPQAVEPIGKRGAPIGRAPPPGGAWPPGGRPGSPLGRKVEEQKVDRPALDERPGHRQPVVDRIRREDDEPFEADPAGDRLDRIEAPGEIEIGDDRAARLGLGGEAKGERRLAARQVTPDGDARVVREAARPEDRVERGEAGPDDPAVARPLGRDRLFSQDVR